jgi:hypothetical protein
MTANAKVLGYILPSSDILESVGRQIEAILNKELLKKSEKFLRQISPVETRGWDYIILAPSCVPVPYLYGSSSSKPTVVEISSVMSEDTGIWTCFQCCGSEYPDPTFFHPGSKVDKIPDPGSDPHKRILVFSTQKIYADLDFLPSRILDPGSRANKAPDSRSATLLIF